MNALDLVTVLAAILLSLPILKGQIGGKGFKLSDIASIVAALLALTSLMLGHKLGAIFFIPASIFVSRLRWRADKL